MLIYKILRPAEWDALQRDGQTDGAPVDLADGYIHFSTADQVTGTLAKHFAGEGALHLLACDPATMQQDLKWEEARGGVLFPHLYRPLRMADVIWNRPIPHVDGHHDAGSLE
ncbi:DUF952 domain-containing protein [Paracoccus caeni]|uniref:DUF952 domain-containing protein n=1 Tax=Paracoccus caeni TaxID=657651 RepID=A0A934W2K0_9RHOB|nr:DUF952 domain-containing protein [Paracoccus caeni]MBK4217859.1 DUF952 domain-containing protein [Paracoccus caeni]